MLLHLATLVFWWICKLIAIPLAVGAIPLAVGPTKVGTMKVGSLFHHFFG
jgi:hypothetical protein